MIISLMVAKFSFKSIHYYIVENTKNTFSEEFFSNTFITAIFDDVCNIIAFWPTLDHSFVPLSPSRKNNYIL